MIIYHLEHKLNSKAHFRIHLAPEDYLNEIKKAFLSEPSQFSYQQVAILSDEVSLEEAFDLTNSVEQHWTKNFPGTFFGYQNRSTSVGDVILKDNVLYVVDHVGFLEIPI